MNINHKQNLNEKNQIINNNQNRRGKIVLKKKPNQNPKRKLKNLRRKLNQNRTRSNKLNNKKKKYKKCPLEKKAKRINLQRNTNDYFINL